ncbi:hypothetical protein MICRO116_1000003 [Micrococcus sp. 116]|nr:hypothetical protein MICRO116_1000003 [Micrococcus sp. 116]
MGSGGAERGDPPYRTQEVRINAEAAAPGRGLPLRMNQTWIPPTVWRQKRDPNPETRQCMFRFQVTPPRGLRV